MQFHTTELWFKITRESSYAVIIHASLNFVALKRLIAVAQTVEELGA